ncbi:MAG: glycosyltransferase, partial [Pseudomonadota bacterium]
NYVKECWEAIVETSVWAEKDLPAVLDKVQPDLICVDNVILFPAIKRYGRENNVPWVRIISCSENEIPDPDIPPHLSGCGEADRACFERFDKKFKEIVGACHAKFNEFLKECGEEAYELGEFFEASPHMNLLLYPEPVKFNRRTPLDPAQFQYLEGCVRDEKAYDVPSFGAYEGKPLLYISFGSLGSGDTDLLKRIIDVVGGMDVRALVNVGDYSEAYGDLPANVRIYSWFPQPSVISQADAVIHHGGNNSFNECLYFGKPAIIMPYVWDGHDNATRVQETGHGLHMHRSNWAKADLEGALNKVLGDAAMKAKLTETAEHMQSRHGPTKAAGILNSLVSPA